MMTRFRPSIRELMVVVAILGFDLAILATVLRAGWSDRLPATLAHTFGFPVGFLFFAPLAILNLLAARQAAGAERRGLILGLLMTWPPFLLFAAGTIHHLTYGR